MRDPIVEFRDYNRAFAQRNPELLRLKVERMAASPFAFFRGTFHLFARDLLDKSLEFLGGTGTGIELDLVGDIHSENFGTFQAEDGKVHYDVNDFDETTQGRFDLDVRRLTTSFILAAQARKDSLADSISAALALLTSYTDTLRRLLKKGKDFNLDVSEAAPSGCSAVDHLLRDAAAAKRVAFIEKHTEVRERRRRLVRSVRHFNLPDNEHQQALRLLEDYRRRMPPPPTADYYELLDACGRVAGIGSMGRLRYVVLIAGKGDKEARNVLLEFKEACPSAYDLHRQRQTDDAARLGRAERVITVQRLSQTVSNPRLGFALDGKASFQVRELGPHDARLDESKPAADLRGLAQVQAAVLAKIHARATARAVGVANPLAEFKEGSDAFSQRTLAFALAYADLTQRDWQRFVGQRAELDRAEDWSQAAS